GEYDGTPTDASRLEVENLTENTGFVDIGLAKKPALIDRGFATGVRYRSSEPSAEFTPKEAAEIARYARLGWLGKLVSIAEGYAGQIVEGQGNQQGVAGRASFVAGLAEKKLEDYPGDDRTSLLTRAQLVSINSSKYLTYHTDSFAEGGKDLFGDASLRDILELL
ncbi:MAG: hypothetical protein V1820_03380, partial [archaeon]